MCPKLLAKQPGEGFLLLKFPLKISTLPKAFFQPGLRQFKKKKKRRRLGDAKENTTASLALLQLCLQGVCFVPPKILSRKTVNLDAVASNVLASIYFVSFSISLFVTFLLLVS